MVHSRLLVSTMLWLYPAKQTQQILKRWSIYVVQMSLCRWYKSRGSLKASDRDAVCCAWNAAAVGDGTCFPCVKQSSFRPAVWEPSSCPKHNRAVEKLEKKTAWNLTPLQDESNAPEPWPALASHPRHPEHTKVHYSQGPSYKFMFVLR